MRPGILGAAAVGTVVAAIAAAAFWSVSRTAGPPASPPAAAQVVGRVELAPGAAPAPWASDAVVVIYAYALDGPRLPLAVLRRPATALPFDFKLDDSLAQNPAYRLSRAAQLVVGARLGPGDAAIAQAGDWLAPSQTLPLGTHGVRLVLQAPKP